MDGGDDDQISLSEEDFDDISLEGEAESDSGLSLSDDSDDDSSDDSDSEEQKKRICVALLVQWLRMEKSTKQKNRRRAKVPRNRRCAHMLLQEGIDDGLFRTEYRMSPVSFRKLVELLRDDLEPKDKKNNKKRRKDYLDPETKVMMMLRWLAGGQYVDQCRCNGVSRPSVF